jgi:hypothetical protein
VKGSGDTRPSNWFINKYPQLYEVGRVLSDVNGQAPARIYVTAGKKF